MGLMDYFKELLGVNMSRVVHDVEDEVKYFIHSSLRKTSRYVVKAVFSALLIFLSILFISGAALFFLVDYTTLGRAASALIVGIIILFIALIAKFMN